MTQLIETHEDRIIISRDVVLASFTGMTEMKITLPKVSMHLEALKDKHQRRTTHIE